MNADIRKQLCHKTRAAKQHDPAVSTDERRAHKTHDDKNVNEVFAKHIVAGHKVRDRNSHQKCGTGGHDGYEQASSQC